MRSPESTTDAAKVNGDRWVRGVFTLAAILFALFSQDRSLGFTFLGLVLVMDPFDQGVMWSDRPRWQRVWPFTHLGVTAAALGWYIGVGDRLEAYGPQ